MRRIGKNVDNRGKFLYFRNTMTEKSEVPEDGLKLTRLAPLLSVAVGPSVPAREAQGLISLVTELLRANQGSHGLERGEDVTIEGLRKIVGSGDDPKPDTPLP